MAEEEQRKKVTNSEQFEKMVEELQNNPSLARGFGRGTTPSNFKEKWNEISMMLNALGPPRRNGDGWQKVLRDFKFKVKKKMTTNKNECLATGGGRYKQIPLSPLDEAVANLLQFQKQLNPEGTVQGIQCPNLGKENELPDIHDILDELTDNNESCAAELQTERELPGSSSASTVQQPKPVDIPRHKETITSKKKETILTKRKNGTSGRNELLKQHSDQQVKLLTDISNTLSSMKRSLKDLTCHQKKLLGIEEKKLKLMEETNKRDEERCKRDEEMHKAELKIKKIKFLIKEKELELLNIKT